MKFFFGQIKQRRNSFFTTIDARTLEEAIQFFKISQLHPEQYIRKDDIANISDYFNYNSALKRCVIIPKVDAIIEIFSDPQGANKEGEIALSDCINNKFKPKNLPLLTFESEIDKNEDLPIVKNSEQLRTKNNVELSEIHDTILQRKAEYETIIKKLNDSLVLLNEEVNNKRKIIYVLNTFLGTNEKVYQLIDGEPAPENEKLAMFQQVLYMDEEIGIIENQGLGFEDIDKFDKWILKNYKLFLYKPKSVVAWQVRRHGKEYSDSIFVNSKLNEENFKTYFLIRNGENLYRIWADVRITEKLFPKENEFKPAEKFEWSSAFKSQKQQYELYMYGLFALQGLIERTEIFGQEIRKHVDLPRGKFSDKIELIRDTEQEFWISDGRLSFKNFIEENRKTIKKGSRVLITNLATNRDNGFHSRTYPFSALTKPSQDIIYRIEKVEILKFEIHYFLYYLPLNDYIYSKGDFKKRKNRIPYRAYKDELINVDTITIEDCEYYLNNRIERKNYLYILPILKNIIKVKKEEIELDGNFARFIIGEMNLEESEMSKIMNLVSWWKFKNNIKRGLRDDDAKAIRMIKRKYLSKNK